MKRQVFESKVWNPGMKADLPLFSPVTLIDTSTVAQPPSLWVRIPNVVANVVVVAENGMVTGARPGVEANRDASIGIFVPPKSGRYTGGDTVALS